MFFLKLKKKTAVDLEKLSSLWIDNPKKQERALFFNDAILDEIYSQYENFFQTSLNYFFLKILIGKIFPLVLYNHSYIEKHRIKNIIQVVFEKNFLKEEYLERLTIITFLYRDKKRLSNEYKNEINQIIKEIVDSKYPNKTSLIASIHNLLNNNKEDKAIQDFFFILEKTKTNPKTRQQEKTMKQIETQDFLNLLKKKVSSSSFECFYFDDFIYFTSEVFIEVLDNFLKNNDINNIDTKKITNYLKLDIKDFLNKANIRLFSADENNNKRKVVLFYFRASQFYSQDEIEKEIDIKIPRQNGFFLTKLKILNN